MGGCFSSAGEARGGRSSIESSYHRRSNTSANVISANGDLHQYTLPLAVSQLLHMEIQRTPAATTTNQHQQSSPPSKFCVCNSDRLYYDDFIPSLDAEEQLQADQIYFVLPISKLQYRLTASDMAALAVKATLALQKHSTNSNSSSSINSRKRSSSSFYLRNRPQGGHGNYNKSARISPILVDQVINGNNSNSSSWSSDEQTVRTIKKGISNKQPAAVVSKSESVRKWQRYSSRRAKMAARSFRMIKLSTIHEEASVLQFY